MRTTDSGIAMLAKELHFRKALSAMAGIDSGIVMVFKDGHNAKTDSPMAVTDWGPGDSNAYQRIAFIKGTFPNGRHRLRDCNAC